MFSLFKAHRQLAVSLVLIFSAVVPRSRTPTVLPPGGEDRTTLEIAGRVFLDADWLKKARTVGLRNKRSREQKRTENNCREREEQRRE